MNIENSLNILSNSKREEERFDKEFLTKNLSIDKKKSVLGLDILGYSQFGNVEQYYIPILFNLLVKSTIKDIFHHEKYIFQTYDHVKIKENFIDTGDGGFFIFDTPLHSILFALYFECNLRHYNIGTYNKEIFKLIGHLKIRYGISYDIVYFQNELRNFYGAGIINCSRMMAKDKLDRCIIDENTYQWFLKNTNGIESLRNYHIHKITKIPEFKNYIFDEKDYKVSGYSSYAIPEIKTTYEPGIDLINIMKIGSLKVKKSEISVYNLLIQLPTKIDERFKDLNTYEDEFMVVSLGNNNTEGLAN
ncbi:hypothetical protein LEP1GSC202_0380 [Leptospira yanagawae serovar Saopaulo str. Sao Paulo = ATCC 700523]|uniref:Guanylate cyclase domain-containing protein n=1 Tax=Leptospira yanagawae serovar Saopaulo str. Sao Paulo = ATCC 700523 TaxID=1249483 RepID=A0A5E8HD20_9LEPT|nr:hypothetical protein [Leptospira yanagawae]EOQ87926.1 hypothetical protein LEP1GSC202_0380 [Leptospira yanagawae serovar Saopaulo str. Sao Paulo = ATCC 700523]